MSSKCRTSLLDTGSHRNHSHDSNRVKALLSRSRPDLGKPGFFSWVFASARCSSHLGVQKFDNIYQTLILLIYSRMNFRQLCQQHGLAMTHQRQVIYESLAEMPDHPSPEDVYAVAKKAIPAISLATVYKTLHTFVEHGILRELSLHHGTMRVDWKTHSHHHLICTRCKKVMDIEDDELDPVKVRRKLPKGFKVERVAVEVQGICAECSKQ